MKPRSDNGMQGATVLLVDDDHDFLDQTRLTLEQAGFKVLVAETRKAAEETLQDTRPDVAVLDLMLEEMDAGFVLCYHIKKRYPDVPVVMVSSVHGQTGYEFDAATDEERSWLKADVSLAKPVRPEQLLGEIHRLMKEAADGETGGPGR